jgi:hypothetical protein
VKSGRYGFAVAAGDAAGGTLPTGDSPAIEAGASEAAGEAWTGAVAGDAPGGFAAVGAGEASGALCVFISSRLNALSAVLLCA